VSSHRRRAAVALAVYGVAVGFIVLWPVPVDRPFDVPLLRVLGALKGSAVRPIDAYNALEAVSNVLMFVPAGLLIVVLVGRARWWIAPVAGLGLSAAAEAAQYALLPERTATVADVIANTAGALIGAGLALAVGRRRIPRG